MLTEVFAIKGIFKETQMGLRESTKTAKNPISALYLAMEHLWALSYIAAEKKVSLSLQKPNGWGKAYYGNAAASRKRQRLQNIHKDEDSQFSPPDKGGHFCGKEIICK